VGGKSSAKWRQAEVATVQVKIGRGDYDSPVAIAYMMAATYNMVIKQLVNPQALIHTCVWRLTRMAKLNSCVMTSTFVT
jgi:hypothetical protein